MKPSLILLFVFLLPVTLRAQDSLDTLASDFWTWRAQFQPFNADDIPRIERRPVLKRSWSAVSVARQRADLTTFEARWKNLDFAKWPVAQQVDYRLMGSALARVHFELDLNRRWQRDPTFYVDQTMAALTDVFLAPPPFDEQRSREAIARLQNIPSILEEAKANLKEPAAPFTKLAINSLADIRAKMQIVTRDVAPLLAGTNGKDLAPAAEQAVSALEGFRQWLQRRLPSMTSHTAVGREVFAYFLKNVALYPFTPEQLLDMSRQEWARSVVSEHMEHERNKSLPELKRFVTLDEQLKRTADLEEQVRQFLTKQQILTVPSDFPRYVVRSLPAYLAALGNFSELDDFTGPSHLNQECTRWAAEPSPTPGYFEDATLRDPRPLIVHEGVPGHYMQLWMGWRHPDPIRRHYYDSGANEGLGFYAEEMMLQAGLFEDSPRTREIIYNWARLRALRVEVDVKLALGQMTADQARKYLSEMVPMNPTTAQAETALFATQPGQAISYQVGKLQIMQFLADARLRAGGKFDTKVFNDFVWRNGNVPIELQRMEWFATPDSDH